MRNLVGASLEDAETVGRRYRSAQPFPHIVIGDFLPESAATALANSFPRVDQMSKLFKGPMSFKGQISDISNTGFLDLHVDANFHPIDKGLHRRVSLPVMNLAILNLKPYAKYLRRKSTFDALPKQD